MRLTSFACALFLVACSDLGLSTGTGSSGGGGSTGAASTGTSTTSGASAGGGGVACATDPQTGITLCEGLNACAGLQVDQGAFPNCGFRLHGAGPIDLECLCNGSTLCPIGAPTTCSDAAQLLGQQGSALTVCQQIDQGGCLDLGADGGAASSGSCDRACESQCQSDPGCISLCGC
jgi:hypothetical protein